MLNPIHDFWFNSEAKDIYIVCSREANPPKWAYKYHNNYAYSDNFGDKDLLFYLYGLMSKYYPNTNIHFYFSEDYMEKIRGWEEKNILIVGGPNSRNQISKFGMYEVLRQKIKSISDGSQPIVSLLYPPKLESEARDWENRRYCKETLCKNCSNFLKECPRLSLCINIDNDVRFIMPEYYDELIIPTIDANDAKVEENRRCREISNGKKVAISGCVKKDIGFFSSLDNPFDSMKGSRIVLLSGLHTFGGVGVFNALSAQTKHSIDNYNLLYYSLIGRENRDFMTYFEIDVSEQREASHAHIFSDRIFSLSHRQLQNYYNVFISYRRESGTNISTKLYNELIAKREMGIYPFRDRIDAKNSFKPGIDYVKDICNKIKTCEIFILTITKGCFVCENEVDGGFKDEFITAIKFDKQIIPIEEKNSNYYEELLQIKDEIVELFGIEKFKQLQHYNAIKMQDFDQLVTLILASLQKHYGEQV